MKNDHRSKFSNLSNWKEETFFSFSLGARPFKTFKTASLRKILRIFWPRKISNDELLNQTKQEDSRTFILVHELSTAIYAFMENLFSADAYEMKF